MWTSSQPISVRKRSPPVPPLMTFIRFELSSEIYWWGPRFQEVGRRGNISNATTDITAKVGAQELCESRRPGLPVPNSHYGLRCGRKQHWTWTAKIKSALRSTAVKAILTFHYLWGAKPQDSLPPQTTTLEDEKGESNRGMEPPWSAYQPSTLMLGQPPPHSLLSPAVHALTWPDEEWLIDYTGVRMLPCLPGC